MMFILEHPRKGTVVAVPGDRDEKYHFSWSKLRSDESTLTFTLQQARLHKKNPDLPADTVILKCGTWEPVS